MSRDETDEGERRECWLVSGRVQGVGFRYHVARVAQDAGVSGDVRNLPDGRVEVRAAGAAAAVERLLEAVRRGPAGARVEDLITAPIGPDYVFRGFRIRD